MTIINPTPGLSESLWISSTSPVPSETEVSRIGDFYVELARTVSSKSLVGCAKLLDPAGVEVIDAFDAIDASNDYNSVRRRLTLHLSKPLDELTMYTLIIDGLYAATGESQDKPHVFMFTTTAGGVDLTPETESIDYIKVVDMTTVDRPLRVVDGEAEAAIALVRTLPVNGAYSLSPAYNSGVVSLFFSENAGDPTGHILVERRVISVVETSYDVVAPGIAVSVTNPKQVDVTLPEVTAGVYIEPGYEYRVTVMSDMPVGTGVLGTERSIKFCGRLEPMFASVQNVLMNYPGYTSYDVALMIFYASMEVLDVKPNMDVTRPTKPAAEYVMYSTLARLADMKDEDFKSIQLMDLIIDRGDAPVLSAKWRQLAEQAWARLSGGGPQVGIKGGTRTSPFVTRDWKSSSS